MDVKEYRRQSEAEVARAATEARRLTSSLGFAFAGAASRPGSGVAADLNLLGDVEAETSARRTALTRLRAAQFLGPQFAPFRAEFLETLRRILTPHGEPALRIEAAEVLAAEKDRSTQALLRKGLIYPPEALVPPAEALEYLAYDDHEDAGRLALEVLRSHPDVVTREAALRVLGDGVEASDVFAAYMADKSEVRSLRALGAIGLSRSDPARFAHVAAQVVLDEDDDPDIRATSLGALARSPELSARLHPTVAEAIRSLYVTAVPEALRSIVAQFIQLGR